MTNAGDSSTGAVSRRRFLQATATASVGVQAISPANATAVIGTAEQEYADKITVYTWGGAAGKAMEKYIIQPFEEEYGITVEHLTFGSAGELLSKLKAGTAKADVVDHWNETVYPGTLQDVWAPIPRNELPHYDNVVKNLRTENVGYDPKGNRSVPFAYGGNGIVYNYEAMEEPSKWDDIYTEQTKGRVSLASFISNVVSIAAADIGLDFNKLDQGNTEQKMQKVWDRVKFQNEYLLQWWDSASTMQQLLTSRSVITGMLWYGRTNALRNENNVLIRYTLPEEGTSGWTDVLSVPRGPATKSDKRWNAAMQYIDWNLREETARRFIPHFPSAWPLTFDETGVPKELQKNPNYTESEKLQFFDAKLLHDHKQEWTQKFQTVIRG